MRKYEAITVKIKRNYAIVLNDRNQYDRILKKSNMSVGAKIMYTDADIITNVKNSLNSKNMWKAGIAVAAALLLVFGFFALPGLFSIDPMDSAAAMVIVDINPSVKLFITEDDEVIAAVAMNDDAKQLELDDLYKYSVSEAIEIIVNRAIEKGFLDVNDLEDDYILLTEVDLSGSSDEPVTTEKPQTDAEDEYDDEKDEEDWKERLAQRLLQSEILNNVNIAMIEATLDQLNKAVENNVPAGLFAVDGGVNINGTVMTVREFFADDGLAAKFLAKGEVLEQNYENKLAVMGTYLNLLDDDTVDKESLQQAFQLAKNDFFEAKTLYNKALNQYKEALKSNDESAIAKARYVLDRAEEFKDRMEEMKDDLDTIKDALKLQIDKQELEDDLDDDEFELEAEKIREEERIIKEKFGYDDDDDMDDDDDDDDMDDDDDDEDMDDDDDADDMDDDDDADDMDDDDDADDMDDDDDDEDDEDDEDMDDDDNDEDDDE